MTLSEPRFLISCSLGGDTPGAEIDYASLRNWSPAAEKIWLHLDVADAASRSWLLKESGLPAQAVDTLLAEETRPRSSLVDSGLLLVLRGVNTNPGQNPEDMVSVRVWVDPDRVITSRRRRLLSAIDLHETLKAGDGPATPGEFLADLVGRLADRIGGFVDSIEEQIEAAEETLSVPSQTDSRAKVAGLRRQIAAVRRFLAPQRDALDRLNRQPIECLAADDMQHLRDETDRITRYLEDLDLARERSVVLQEELFSLLAQEQNSRMYVLSVVAAIFLPLTFVTGLLGMNVGGLPGLDSPQGFTASLIVMAAAGVALLVFFRWKRWL